MSFVEVLIDVVRSVSVQVDVVVVGTVLVETIVCVWTLVIVVGTLLVDVIYVVTVVGSLLVDVIYDVTVVWTLLVDVMYDVTVVGTLLVDVSYDVTVCVGVLVQVVVVEVTVVHWVSVVVLGHMPRRQRLLILGAGSPEGAARVCMASRPERMIEMFISILMASKLGKTELLDQE